MNESGAVTEPLADLLAAWRAAGLAAHQPVRFRLLEAMCGRLPGRPPAARALLQARLRQAMAAYLLAATAQAADAGREPLAPGLPSGQKAGPSTGPLTALLAHAARQSAADGPAAEAPPELKALRWFRGTWSRLSADQRLNQSLAQVPDNAGPLNSQQLVHRSLALMRTLSPDYLQHFVAQVDTLMWLDQVNSGEIATGTPDSAPRRPGRGRRHAVG